MSILRILFVICFILSCAKDVAKNETTKKEKKAKEHLVHSYNGVETKHKLKHISEAYIVKRLRSKNWNELIKMNKNIPKNKKELLSAIEKRSKKNSKNKSHRHCGNYMMLHNALKNPALSKKDVDHILEKLESDVPPLNKEFVIPHFKIKYTTNNADPKHNVSKALVRKLARTLELVYNEYTNDHKVSLNDGKTIIVRIYSLPEDDGDGNTSPGGPINFDSTAVKKEKSYFKVLVFHELFHKVQFAKGYLTDFQLGEKWDGVFSEGTAAWAEARYLNKGLGEALTYFHDIPEDSLFDVPGGGYSSVSYWMSLAHWYNDKNLAGFLNRMKSFHAPSASINDLVRDTRKPFNTFPGTLFFHRASYLIDGAWKGEKKEIYDYDGKKVRPSIRYSQANRNPEKTKVKMGAARYYRFVINPPVGVPDPKDVHIRIFSPTVNVSLGMGEELESAVTFLHVDKLFQVPIISKMKNYVLRLKLRPDKTMILNEKLGLGTHEYLAFGGSLNEYDFSNIGRVEIPYEFEESHKISD